jgi:hypothetical protein
MKFKIRFDYKRLADFVEYDHSMVSKDTIIVKNTYDLAEILSKTNEVLPSMINRIFTNLLMFGKIIKVERNDDMLYLFKYLKDRGFIHFEQYNEHGLCLIMARQPLFSLFDGCDTGFDITEYRNACSQCMNKRVCVNFGLDTHRCKQRILYRSKTFMTFDHTLCPAYPECAESHEGCHYLFGENVLYED